MFLKVSDTTPKQHEQQKTDQCFKAALVSLCVGGMGPIYESAPTAHYKKGFEWSSPK